MAKPVWYELRPYRTDTDVGEDSMLKLLDHLDKFLIVIYRDESSKIRIYVRTLTQHLSTISTLKGMEAIYCNEYPPDLNGMTVYKKYGMRRHCAYSIIPKNMIVTSIYRAMGNMSGCAFLTLNLRKVDAAPPINDFIATCNRGQNPESKLTNALSTGKSEKKASHVSKMTLAREKLASRNLFLCRMFSGVKVSGDDKIIEAVFPSRAFISKKIDQKQLKKDIVRNIGFPLFGGDKNLVLSDSEIFGFLSLPNNDDISNVEFDIGRLSSTASGLAEGSFGTESEKIQEGTIQQEDFSESEDSQVPVEDSGVLRRCNNRLRPILIKCGKIIHKVGQNLNLYLRRCNNRLRPILIKCGKIIHKVGQNLNLYLRRKNNV